MATQLYIMMEVGSDHSEVGTGEGGVGGQELSTKVG